MESPSGAIKHGWEIPARDFLATHLASWVKDERRTGEKEISLWHPLSSVRLHTAIGQGFVNGRSPFLVWFHCYLKDLINGAPIT